MKCLKYIYYTTEYSIKLSISEIKHLQTKLLCQNKCLPKSDSFQNKFQKILEVVIPLNKNNAKTQKRTCVCQNKFDSSKKV